MWGKMLKMSCREWESVLFGYSSLNSFPIGFDKLDSFKMDILNEYKHSLA